MTVDLPATGSATNTPRRSVSPALNIAVARADHFTERSAADLSATTFLIVARTVR